MFLWAGAAAGCSASNAPADNPSRTSTLRVGFGLSTGTSGEAGMKQFAQNISLEALVNMLPTGRAIPWVAESWSVSDDGLVWRFAIRPGVKFHSGRPFTAAAAAEVLRAQLPLAMGPAFVDVAAITAESDRELVFTMKRRSNFVLESLNGPLTESASGSGTGPFVPIATTDESAIELKASDSYYGERPRIDRIITKAYPSMRSAWADMLRGQVDMLYEVGLEALDSLQPSSDTKIFTFRRPYAYLAILNLRRPVFADKRIRRSLNAAVDRAALVRDILGGRGAAAEGPVSPLHWAYDPSAPHFTYEPRPIGAPVRFSILYADPSYERLALALQRQLDEAGVEVRLEQAPMDEALHRVQAGDFDAFLSDFPQGPNLFKPYLFWYSGAPVNWGHFSSAAVDAALDLVRVAKNDDDYRAGVAEFQRTIVDDPPAIFLAWGERARAVSARFEVPVEPGRDILSTLRLWRPVGQARYATGN